MLAILTTHPIQYQVPLWQALAKDGRVPFEVWYLSEHATRSSRDREFQQDFAWDLDMLKDYPHRFLKTPSGATPNTRFRLVISESLPELFRKTQTRVVWVQGWQVAGYWQAVWAARKAGLQVWLRGESNDLASVPWWKKAAKRVLLGQLFKRIDRFFYIGSANRRLYEKFGVPKEKLVSAPYAVDNARFARQASELRGKRKELREEWKIPQDAFCVLFCGKFIPKKRPMDLIEAARLLVSSDSQLLGPNSLRAKLHLLFVGSGELGAQLRAACNVVFDAERPSFQLPPAISENPRASFAGFLNQTEISKAYVAADALVLPSDYRETWGLVVNEAMASELPCIISDQCGCAEDLGVPPNAAYRCGNVPLLAERISAFSSGNPDRKAFHRTLSHHSFAATVNSVAHAVNRTETSFVGK